MYSAPVARPWKLRPSRPSSVTNLCKTRLACLLLCLACSLAVANSKRLIAFGDSITDNGNGTSKVVQAFYTQLLGQQVTAAYPPGPFFADGRWSDGPTWIEYLSDAVGYELYNRAIGSATTNRSISFHLVGDFYPSTLLSNRKGAFNVSLPTFADQIAMYLKSEPVTAQDVVVIEIGVNDLLGFFESNILQTLQFVEDATMSGATFPMYIIDGVGKAIREGMEVLYAAGARKFIVWHVSAGDVVPMVNTMNNFLNLINTILTGLGQLEAKPNALKAYTKGFVDLANAAITNVATIFSAAHKDVQLEVFPFAEVQRNLVAGYDSLGFVNAVSGCTSDFTFTQYSTSNLYSLANPTFTAEGAKATLSLSPLFVSKLNKLGADVNGLNGKANVPQNSADFIARLKDIISTYLDDSNTLGHMTGYILTSAPLGRGGWNPYDIVPTCLLQAGDHLFHDEVHPTTKQHLLLARAVNDIAGHLFT